MHRRIVEQRDHGVAVVIVSSELDEIYALADRIAVMYEGKITGFRDPDVPAAELGRLMAGGADSRRRATAPTLPRRTAALRRCERGADCRRRTTATSRGAAAPDAGPSDRQPAMTPRPGTAPAPQEEA